MERIKKNISKLSEQELLSLMAASSVSRKSNILDSIFTEVKLRNINEKKIYESLLQIYLFAGYPCALVTFKQAQKFFKFRKIKRKKNDFTFFAKQGEKTSKKIYGKNVQKLISNIQMLSADLSEWFIVEGYGKVLSRKNLSLKERELQIISMLTCLAYKDQLLSHIIGALRNGASCYEVQKIITNLRILNSKKNVSFGLKVFNEYIQKSGIILKTNQN